MIIFGTSFDKFGLPLLNFLDMPVLAHVSLFMVATISLCLAKLEAYIV